MTGDVDSKLYALNSSQVLALLNEQQGAPNVTVPCPYLELPQGKELPIIELLIDHVLVNQNQF